MDLSSLDPEQIPRHVGLIMDGNGRWANARSLPRIAGHKAGEEALFDVVHGALEIGIEWLSAYTFSTENWARDPEEVEFLMFFNRDLLIRRRDELHDLGVRIRFAGDLGDPRIPDENREYMAGSERLTLSNSTMNMVFVFNYGSRWEITEAARRAARAAVRGEIDPDQLDQQAFTRFFAVPDMPDLDLVIRSSGEHRLSNYLMWQAAYAEFSFPGILWPDFDRRALLDSVVEYQQRDRRFGGAIDKPVPSTLQTEADGLIGVRDEIDTIDAQIVALLAQRQRRVERAAGLKSSEDAVRATDRVEQVVAKVRALAAASDASPEVVETTYRAMVDAFIELELGRADV
jgi:undecaprenyl diphosphate synthase